MRCMRHYLLVCEDTRWTINSESFWIVRLFEYFMSIRSGGDWQLIPNHNILYGPLQAVEGRPVSARIARCCYHLHSNIAILPESIISRPPNLAIYINISWDAFLGFLNDWVVVSQLTTNSPYPIQQQYHLSRPVEISFERSAGSVLVLSQIETCFTDIVNKIDNPFEW